MRPAGVEPAIPRAASRRSRASRSPDSWSRSRKPARCPDLSLPTTSIAIRPTDRAALVPNPNVGPDSVGDFAHRRRSSRSAGWQGAGVGVTQGGYRQRATLLDSAKQGSTRPWLRHLLFARLAHGVVVDLSVDRSVDLGDLLSVYGVYGPLRGGRRIRGPAFVGRHVSRLRFRLPRSSPPARFSTSSSRWSWRTSARITAISRMQGRHTSMGRDRPRDLLNPRAGQTRLLPASRGTEGADGAVPAASASPARS